MAPPFLLTSLLVLLAWAEPSTAIYEISDEYPPSVLFSKFDFIVSKYGTGNPQDVDPTEGFVYYRNESFAEANGLIKTTADCAYIYANSKDVFNGTYGRDSVRIESKDSYTHGLFVWTFEHLPKAACGAWPAVWTYGPNWPYSGEVDVYEGWNLATANSITGHSGGQSSCLISRADFSGTETTSDCNTFSSTQYYGQGCSVSEQDGQWANPSGGIYAMEWTSENISVWSWPPGGAPLDVETGAPDPAFWGQPHFQVESSLCNIDQMFANHKLVLNIDFCGTSAGNPTIWSLSGCPTQNGETCQDYVGANPEAFVDVYFGIRKIEVYTQVPTSTSISTSTSPSMTATSSPTSATVSPSSSGYTTSTSVVSVASSTSQLQTSTLPSSTSSGYTTSTSGVSVASSTSQLQTSTLPSPPSSITSTGTLSSLWSSTSSATSSSMSTNTTWRSSTTGMDTSRKPSRASTVSSKIPSRCPPSASSRSLTTKISASTPHTSSRTTVS